MLLKMRAVGAVIVGGLLFGADASQLDDAMFSPGYFWMWNAPLEKSRLDGQLKTMAENSLRAVCVHPFPKDFRTGVFTSEMSPDYLTGEYLTTYAFVVNRAEKLGMHVWLYDEGGWPSGGACGKVAASDPEGRFQFRVIGRDSSGRVSVRSQPYGDSRDAYVSMLEPGATERFIELTHEAYYRAMPDAFGRTIRAAFTDEPFGPRPKDGGLGWTSDFAEVFQKEKGYDIMPFVPDLLDEKHLVDEKVAKVRIDYFEVMADLFCDRYLLPIRDWCRKHKILSGGHLDGDDAPEQTVSHSHGNLLKSMRAMDVPGIDVIWRQLYPGGLQPCRAAPFPRYASSAMHQNGGKYALSETFGIFGDSVSPAQMKWLVDYQMVRGINVFVFGYWALSTARQWMLLFEPHSGPVVPYWDMEGPFFRYIRETAKFLAQGHPAVDVAVLYDVRAFWAGGAFADIASQSHAFVSKTLDRANTEYDFVDDEAIASAQVISNGLKVGAMTYRTIVLPTSKWLSTSARAKLDDFIAAGGRICGLDELSEVPQTVCVTGWRARDVRVLKRVDGARALYFLVNEGDRECNVRIRFPERGRVTRWDWDSGRYYKVPFTADGTVKVRMGRSGSKVFVIGGPDGEDEPSFAGGMFCVENGWTIRRQVAHEAEGEDFVIRPIQESPRLTELGDWRSQLGSLFSGKAVYRAEFDIAKAGEARLDLGKVCWCADVSLNGKRLGARFFGPYVFDVHLVEGRNVLEVTVANLLSNQLSDFAIRKRLADSYPPHPNYESRQRTFDLENMESGLFGPVVLKLKD